MTSTEGLPLERVLVVGATGGVGQLTVGKLLSKGFQVRVLTRSASKAQKMFDNRVEIVVGDIRFPTTLSAATQDVTQIICSTGTTAFPSAKWDFDNIQELKGIASLIEWLKLYFKPDYRTLCSLCLCGEFYLMLSVVSVIFVLKLYD
ncbi:MAG: NAD(P)H-binding protein [Symploca sp. SIO2G7]|nr:NAD(P)H-binding protein [Symploca sp. SIO2G7]